MKEGLGLYIHIPYCESKCGYCDFTSYIDQVHTIPAYLQALSMEARRYSDCVDKYGIYWRGNSLLFDTVIFSINAFSARRD